MVLSIICIALVLCFLFFWLYLEKKNPYEGIIAHYKSDYPLWFFFSVAFFILDLMHYDEEFAIQNRKSKRKAKLLTTLDNIYGYLQTPIRYKMHIASMISALAIGGVLMLIFVGGLAYQDDQRNKALSLTLEKPDFYGEERLYEFDVEFKNEGGKEQKKMAIIVPPRIADEKLIKETLATVRKTLEAAWVDTPIVTDTHLSLMTQHSPSLVRISWLSNNPDIIDNNGMVYNQGLSADTKVILTANFIFEGVTGEPLDIPIIVQPYTHFLNRQGVDFKLSEADRVLKENIDQFLEAKDKNQFALPQVHGNGVEITFQPAEKSNYIGAVILVGIMTVILIGYSSMKLNDQKRNKEERIVLAFPEFLSKLILLISAGTPVNAAIDKIVSDYEIAYNANLVKREPLYDELLITLDAINGDSKLSPTDAYEQFARRCKVKEAIRFTALLVQYMKTGTDQFLSVLKMYNDEGWAERKRIAERKGKEAETKLMIPILIIFVAIMMVMLTPISTMIKM